MTVKPKTIYLKDYKPADFCIDNVHLHFDLHEDETVVKTVLAMRRNPLAKTPKAPLVLAGEDMTLNKVCIDGHCLDDTQYQVDEAHLTIADVKDQFTLETEVIIKPQENSKLSGLYKSRDNYCTQCEAHGFRRITYYLDRPDVMSRFSTTITANKDDYPYLLSNGNLLESKVLDNNRLWVHWEDPSLKPCYLFALVAGDFDLLEDKFITCSGRNVKLQLYVEKGFGDQGAYALESLKRAMRWDEQTFGREYDLDTYMIVAVSDFNMGAMENKGLNVFNTKYILAKPESATDNDYVAIEGVIGHEYFHNWSGNRVTCRDWFQITLKEGLTVCRDQLFTEDMTSKGVARINTVNVVRNQQFAEDASSLAHPIRPDAYIEINNFYTLTVYRKGCEVIRMVRTLLTPDVFRQGMDLYFSRHDGQAVTTEEFIKVMEDASGSDLGQFRLWYSQAGTPELTVTDDYNESAKTYTLTVKQSTPPTLDQPDKKPLHIPLAMGLIGPNCQAMPTQLSGESSAQKDTRILELHEAEQSFNFINVEAKPVPSLLRGFSAPVKIQYDYSLEQLGWLVQCDTDMFARWDALQQLAAKILLRLADDYQEGKALRSNAILAETLVKLLEAEHADLNLASKLLELPTVSYLLQNYNSHDVEALHVAREFLKNKIANHCEQRLLNIYHRYRTTKYEYNAERMGERAFKNSCLMYLNSAEKEQHHQLAFDQFSQANNMTDVMGALIALNNHNCEQRKQALSQFYDKWKHEPLVVNKWLLLQASSSLSTTLETVKGLTQHPSFDIRNPNNVYALLVGFGANTMRFHDSSGAGYEFLADQVLAIDPGNPQVAARVLQPLVRWQQFDERRSTKMREQLARIAAVDSLSPDVYELANKGLEG